MKNIKSFNPIVLARNAIAATGLMTILNIIVDALHFSPIFPLSLYYPSMASWFVFNVPADIEKTVFVTLDSLYATRPYFAAIAVIMVGLTAYSYFRSAKKPKAIKIGFAVVIADTVLILLGGIALNTLFELLYHAFLLFYIYKGIKALKEASRV